MTPQETYLYWIKERESVRFAKDSGTQKPWTTDPILQTYKFCNVQRESDRVTKWIADNWRNPYANHPNMWFAMVVARLFNWPPTLELIGFPDFKNNTYDKWIEESRITLKTARDTEKKKIFTGAYLVSTNGVKKDKIDYILDNVLWPIWKTGRGPLAGESLQEYWGHLIQFDGLGSFMAGQVVADLKYIDPILKEASDWWTWAPLGPGSKRGLNRLFGRPLEQNVSQSVALVEFRKLQDAVIQNLGLKLPVHDIQNCCCEVDKYLRLQNNEGSVRSKYPGV